MKEGATLLERHRVLVGSLLLAMMAGAAGLIFFLDDIIDRFRPTFMVVGIFPKAPDLVTDAAVWVAGHPVGRVKQIVLQPIPLEEGALVAVHMRLPRRARTQVRTDSYAQIQSPQLLGAAVVNIEPGSAGMPPLEDGDTIRTFDRSVTVDVSARLDLARAQLDTLFQAVGDVHARFGPRLAVFDQVRREFAAAAAEADRLALDFQQGPAARMRDDPAFRASLQRVRTGMAELRTAVDRYAGSGPGSDGELRAAGERVMASAAGLSTQIDTLERRLQDTGGFIGRAAADTALQQALAATRQEIDALIADVMGNPFRFFRFRF
jgi:ABC-type transporter Mla subunit MlaD